MQTLKGVLFDLDGTLIDSAPDFVLAANALRQDHNLPPMEDKTIRPVVSNGAAAVTEVALALDRDDAQFEPARQQLLDHYQTQLARASALFPGIDAALTKLEQAHVPWGIVTNKPERFAIELLDRLQLTERCSTLICPEHVASAKPDPAGILLGIEQMRGKAPTLAVTNCLYIGDHRRDIEAAINAGCPSIAAAYGYITEDDDPEQWQADFVVTSSKALAELLTTLLL